MSALKKPVLKALSDSHLRAIGMVAAHWAQLEVTLLWIVSRVCKIELKQAVVLAGAQNATAWCEMLRKLTSPVQEVGKPKIRMPIDPICETVQTLLKERNNIVHTAWYDARDFTVGLINFVDVRPKATQKARGAGIPKRGSKIFLETSYTARERLKVASEIQAVERSLFGWWDQRQKVSRLAELQRNPSSPPTPTRKSQSLAQLAKLLPEKAGKKPSPTKKPA